jgi:hypothetical protein
MADDSRTIRVRCTSWDQVESFYTEKLRNGDTLVVRTPFRPALGDAVTVALSLPDGLVFALDGRVSKLGAADTTGKHPVALRMVGLTPEVRAQLAQLVSEARGGPAVPAVAPSTPPVPAPAQPVDAAPAEPRVEDVLPEELDVFQDLETAWKRLRELPAHEVLGVTPDATLRQVRDGYFTLTKRHHPDVFGRYRSPALRTLASEVFIHINLAYDRLRAIAPAAERVPAPAVPTRGGWIAGIEGAEPGAPAAPLDVAGSGEYADISIEAGAIDDEEALPDEPPEPEIEVGTSSEDVPFDTARITALTAEELFGEPKQERAASQPGAAKGTVPPRTPTSPPVATAAPPTVLIARGREALVAGKWGDARTAFAEVLRADSRNRAVRALYHVASGMELRSRGDGAQAQQQFETALAHDRDCEEARQALTQQTTDKKGLFKRLFDR